MYVYRVPVVNRFIRHLRDLWICFCGFTPPVTPSIFPTIGIRAFGACRKRFQGPKLKIRMSYKREIPRLNRDNFLAWQGLMRLHLAFIFY